MRKCVFILTINLFALAVCQGQINGYYPFPDSSFWRVDMHCLYAQTNCNEFYYYDYYFGGDTILNGTVHKKIMRDSVVIVGIEGPPCLLYPWASFTGYMGALQEDSLNNKVNFVWPNQSNDTLLYDYNLNVGDTIKGFLANGCNVIHTIDSVLVGGEYRKKWNYNSCNKGAGYIIQGIGSDNGLIEKINSQGFCFSQLICVKDSNNILYTANNSAMGCYRIFTMINSSNLSSGFSIYPNPVSSQLNLQSELYLNDAILTIFNSFGLVKKQLKYINGQSVTLQCDNLSNGLYFLQLTQENKTLITEKFIIRN